jgi:Uncharacterised nucleotidyltransferase
LGCEYPWTVGAPALEIADVLRVVATVGLPRREPEQLRVEVPQNMWPHVLRHLTGRRLTGFASAAVREGRLRLSEDQATQLHEEQIAAMGMVTVLDHLLRRLSASFEEVGISPIVLKGAALGEEFYPDRSWRTYGDVDLLIPREAWVSAARVLADAGFARLLPEPRPGFDERFGKGASFADSQGLQLDLHRTLALGPFGLWIDARDLLGGTSEFVSAGTSMRRLDDTNTMIHACVHAALGQREPLTVPLRDVLQVAWSGRVDWDLMSDRVRAWRLGAPVGHALHRARERLGVPLPADAVELLDPGAGWIERRALAAYTTDRRDRGGSSVAALWAIPGVKARIAYLWAMLFPERRFLDARAEAGSGTIRDRLMIPVRWMFGRTERRRNPKSRGGRA